MTTVLSVQNLTKFYGSIRALNGVSFDVPNGSVFGILGPNGSGKTTLLGIVMDILKPTSGSFQFFGKTPDADTRKHIGTLLETPNFYHYLSGERNLRIAAEIKQKGYDQIDDVLKKVNLYQRKDSKFSTYSLGMKQRLAIASALLGNPDVLVFDEPTNGLDPVGIAEIRDLIRLLATEGKTIIMASHILDEVEKVCSHVAIIQKGDLKTVGTVTEVLSKNADQNVVIEIGSDNLEQLLVVVKTLPGVINAYVEENFVRVVCEQSVTAKELNRLCFEAGIVLDRLNLKRKSLETTFLEITGKVSDR
ncbi:ABC transporter ATP-binding protein [Flavisolibacter ginsenosidimutans]|uniref:ATP-binding cassette domain-containing protein n=1 Tax=Flavisolibacter ginsenosidimutans TaxID=661481 RepID=A0A5B8UJ41_9BACT|nr:ATP-binding cassette domain-containing protein [Flavisolibacter ginsenosidimutans]QEC56025.1 ATP-binding cassette domain-containing protein [Flavisolibacter ginsenosidimutans]